MALRAIALFAVAAGGAACPPLPPATDGGASTDAGDGVDDDAGTGDAGGAGDAAATDAGAPADAGATVDAGASFDAGGVDDAGALDDAGGSDDAGTLYDAGGNDDAGTLDDAGGDDDAGGQDDAGGNDDAGAVEDAGEPNEAGFTSNDAGDPADAGSSNDAGGGAPIDAGDAVDAGGDAGEADAGAPVDAGPPSLVEHFDAQLYGQPAGPVRVDDDHIAVARGALLEILDDTTLATVGSVGLGVRAEWITADGATVHVAAPWGGHIVVDVANPIAPAVIDVNGGFLGRLTAPLGDGRLVTQGYNEVYVQDQNVNDVVGNGYSFAVVDAQHVAVCSSTEIKIYDVTAAPQEVGSAPVSASYDPGTDGAGLLFVPAGSDLVVVDVSDPTQPVVRGATAINPGPVIAVRGTDVLVAASTGLVHVDVTDPDAPSPGATATIFTNGVSPGAVFDAADVVVRDTHGIGRVALAALASVDLDERYGLVGGITASGGRLFISRSWGGIGDVALDVVGIPSAAPTLHPMTASSPPVGPMASTGTGAVCHCGSFQCDVLDPATGTITSVAGGTGYAGRLMSGTDFCAAYYDSVGSQFIYVIDATDPAAPASAAANVAVTNSHDDSGLAGDLLFLASEAEVQVWDLSTRDAPTLSNTVLSGFARLEAGDGALFTASFDTAGMLVERREAATLDIAAWGRTFNFVNRVRTAGPFVIVEDFATFWVLDAATGADVGVFVTGDESCQDVALANDTLWVACASGARAFALP